MARVYKSDSIDPDVTSEDMSKMSNLLNQLSIQVRDTTGAYRPFGDILNDIAEKEKGMTDSQKMAINTQASGIRQANIFAVALSTVGRSQDLTNKAINSSGEILLANSKYLDTVSAKWKILGSTMTSMWQNMVNTTAIKGMIDGLTKVVQVFGNLQTIVMVAVTALLLFKGVAIEKALTSFAISLASIIFDVGVFASVTTGATTAMNALKLAFVTNPLGILALALTAVIGGIMIFNSRTDDQIKKQKELQEQMSQVADQYKASQAEIKGLNELIDEQEKLQAKDTTKLTADEKRRLNDIEVQLASSVPEATTAYDKNNKALAENLDLTKKLVAMKFEEAKGKALEIVSAIDPEAEMAKLKKVKAQMDIVSDLMLKGKSMNANDLRFDVLNSGIGWSDSQQKEIKNSETQIDLLKFLATNHATYSKEVATGTKSLNDYNMASDFTNKNMGTKNKIMTDNSIGIGLNTSEVKANTDALNENANAGQSSETTAEQKAKNLEDLTKAYDKSMSSVSAYNKLMDEYNKNGKFSADSRNEIISSHQELAPYLTDEALLYTKIGEALKSEENTAGDAYKQMMMGSEQYYSSTILGNKGLMTNLQKLYGINLNDYKTVAEAKMAIDAELIKKLGGAWARYFKLVTDANGQVVAQVDSGAMISDALHNGTMGDFGNNYKQAQTDAEAYSKEYNSTFSDLLNIKVPELGDFGAETDKTTDATKGLTQAEKDLASSTKEATNANKDYETSMKSLNSLIKLQDNALSKLNQGSKEYRDGLTAKAKLIQQEIDLTKSSIIVNEKNAKSLSSMEGNVSTTKATTSVTSSSGTYEGGYANGKYKDLINQAGAKYNINSNLLAGIIQTESSFNTNAVNKSSGATGLGQFLSSTAREEGLKDRTSPEQSIDALAKYLVKRISWAGGDVQKAIMGYGENTKAYLNKVLANTPNGTASSGITSTTGDSTTDNGSDKILADVENQKSALIDLQEQLSQFAYQIYQDNLLQFDNGIANASKRISIIQKQIDATTDKSKQITLSTEIDSKLEEELSISQQKDAFIRQEMTNRNYTKGQLSEMNTQLLEIRDNEGDITLEILKQKEAIDSLHVSIITDALDKTLSQSEFILKNLEDASKYNIESDDYKGQLDILIQKQSMYQDEVNKTTIALADLKNTTATTVNGQIELDKQIASTTETLRGNTEALLDNKNAQSDLVKAQVTSLLESQKQSAEITLKQQQENEKNSLSSSIYGGKGTSEENIKAYNEANQIQQDAIQSQIDDLNNKNDVESEIETRLKNQNDLIILQTALEKAQHDTNVRTIVKNTDGTFGNGFVVDIESVETAQKAVDDKITSNNDWEKSTALKHQTDTLSALKQSLADQKTTKDKDYSERLSILETHQTIETNLLTLHYTDMNILVDLKLKELKGIYGNNWTDIITQLTTDLGTAKTLQDSLLLAQASGTLGGLVKGDTSSIPVGSGGNYTVTISDKNGGNQTKVMSESEYNSSETQNNLNGLKGIDGVKVDIKKLNTGGLTKNWTDGDSESNGKLAVVHPNEVWNSPLDTKLLLKTMDISRNIIASISNLKMPSFNGNTNNTDKKVINQFTIQKVEVADGEGFRDFLMDLPQNMMQYMNNPNNLGTT